jgi:hypothetical protein
MLKRLAMMNSGLAFNRISIVFNPKLPTEGGEITATIEALRALEAYSNNTTFRVLLSLAVILFRTKVFWHSFID